MRFGQRRRRAGRPRPARRGGITDAAWLSFGIAAGLGCATSLPATQAPEFEAGADRVFVDPRPIVTSPDDEIEPSISDVGDEVVYAARVAGNLDIYRRPLRGGSAVRLTTHSTDDTEPVFSPDGRWVAWVSQAEDVTGDVWIMGQDGDEPRQLTDRRTADHAPVFSADGHRIFFTSQGDGGAREEIHVVDVRTGGRLKVVNGWDAAPLPDGKHLVFVQLDDRRRPRLMVLSLGDGRIVALTDGSHIEGLPRAARVGNDQVVFFARFVDDQSGDGRADGNDAASLWSIAFDPEVFAGREPGPAVPLTAAEGGEIFASAAAGFIVYTSVGADLDIYALPPTGIINPKASPEVLLAAAAEQESPSLRRLAYRYVVATAPDAEAEARYQLARELAAQERYADAISELERAEQVAAGTDLATLAQLEAARLEMLSALRGVLLVREEAERRVVREALALAETQLSVDSARVRARAATLRGEALYALGDRPAATRDWEALARLSDTPGEDAARALWRLAEVYAQLRDVAAVERVGAQLLGAHAAKNRFAAARLVGTWIELLRNTDTGPATALLQDVLARHGKLPGLGAAAAAALAEEQEKMGKKDAAEAQWRRVADEYAGDREILSRALLALARFGEGRGDQAAAQAAYERILATFADRPALLSRARSGLVRFSLAAAQADEAAARRAKGEARQSLSTRARDSYRILVDNNPDLVVAHRRYIALSFALGQGGEVLRAYRDKVINAPRDKMGHYGLGYALTFTKPVDLDNAEAAVETALGLDPRFAAAHLTMGWLREQQHHRAPAAGYLEEAHDSYQRALGLVDAAADPELHGAALVNLGNALFALGEMDSAFNMYVQREVSGTPFADSLTEVLFRESFARVAMGRDALDVALDQVKLGIQLANITPSRPRIGTLMSLVAAIDLMADNPGEAAEWYGRAEAYFRMRGDMARVVPALRGRARALVEQGKVDEALDAYRGIVATVAEVDDRETRPEPPGVGGFVTELPIDAGNVTRAKYGFSAAQEEQIAESERMAVSRRRNDLVAARAFETRRLALLEEEAADETQRARIEPELMDAWNDSAILAARRGEVELAFERWRAVLGVAERRQDFAAIAVVAKSWLELAQSDLVANDRRAQAWDEVATRVEAARLAAVAAKSPAVPALSRMAALLRVRQASRPLPPGSVANSLPALLASLDSRLALVDEADALAAAAGAEDLRRHLGPSLRPKAEAAGAAPKATGDAKKRVAEPTPTSETEPWWAAFDRALARADFARLGAAEVDDLIAAYENSHGPGVAAERPAFLRWALEVLLARGDVERAWRLAEHDRLLGLQPSTRRLADNKLGVDWASLRGKRQEPEAYAKAVQAAPALLRAVEGVAVGREEVRVALEGEALLAQVFLHAGRWLLFVIDAGGALSHALVEPSPAALAAALAARLGGNTPTLYLDAGELLTDFNTLVTPEGVPLGDRTEFVEVLSATYLLAAFESRRLARDGIARVGPGAKAGEPRQVPAATARLASVLEAARGSLVVHLELGLDAAVDALGRPGTAQARFATEPNASEGERLDLDTLARGPWATSLVVVPGAAPAVRVRRALAQALLFGGVPSVAIGGGPEVVAGLGADLLEQRPASRLRAIPATARGWLIGHRGLDGPGRLALAVAEYKRLGALGVDSYRRALKSRAAEDWQSSRRAFAELIDAIALLREPGSASRLEASADPVAKGLPAVLAQRENGNRLILAQVLQALEEFEAAAAEQARVLQAERDAKRLPEAAKLEMELGKTLHNAKKHAAAADAFGRCVALAAEIGKAEIQAECLYRLAGEYRDTFRHAQAITAYEESIALYGKLASPNELTPQRFLGFHFEGALNNYDRALVHFQAALAIAERTNQTAMVPNLLVDLARVYRQRGDYDVALEKIEAALAKLAPEERAAAELEAARIYWYRGNYRRALERQRDSLRLARAKRDVYLEIQARSLEGLIQLRRGDLEAAERAIADALLASRATGRRGEEAAQLNNLGTVLHAAGRYDEALTSFRAALAIDTELQSSEGRAYDMRWIANSLFVQGKLDEAVKAVDESLSLSREVGSGYNELQALFVRARIGEVKGEAQVKSLYEEAAKRARVMAVAEVEWRAQHALGRLARVAGDRQGSRALFQQSLAVAERLGRGRSQDATDVRRDDVYSDALSLAVEAGDLDDALGLVERLSARRYLDVLSSASIDMPSSAASRTLQAELRARDEALRLERLSGTTAADLAAARGRHEAALGALWKEQPRLARAMTIAPLSRAEIEGRLGKQTAALVLVPGKDHLVALVIQQGRSRGFTLPLSAARLAELSATLRRDMQAFANVDVTLAAFSDVLGPALEHAIVGAEHLVIVASDSLLEVPFAALPLGRERLLDRLSLSAAPSLSWLVDVLRSGEPVRPRSTLAMAAGTDLPFAQLEARAVGGAAARLDGAADEAAVRETSSDALAVAAHVRLDEREPLSSGIELMSAAGDDGVLEAREVFGLAKVPILVTLSACDSAGAPFGEAWLGLAGAFLTAGSRAVVASQTRVSDLGAAVLMKRFYRYVPKVGPSRALRRAALEVRQRFAHPAHWASFVVFGDYR